MHPAYEVKTELDFATVEPHFLLKACFASEPTISSKGKWSKV